MPGHDAYVGFADMGCCKVGLGVGRGLAAELAPLQLATQQGANQGRRVQPLGFEDGFTFLLHAQGGLPVQCDLRLGLPQVLGRGV